MMNRAASMFIYTSSPTLCYSPDGLGLSNSQAGWESLWQLDNTNTRLGRVGMHCLPADVISGNREGRSLRSRARLASVYCAGNQVETYFFFCTVHLHDASRYSEKIFFENISWIGN